jgi:hypothetical protein
MGTVLALTWASNAHADTAGTEAAQVTIAPNGQVMMRGALITAISGKILTATTGWGSTTITWTISLSGSTRYIPEMPSATAIETVQVGDTVNLTGELDTSSATPRILASVFKDASLYEDSATIGGSVVSTDSNARSLTIRNDSGTTTIKLLRGTFMTKAGNTTTLDDLRIGEHVSATGGLNRMSNTLTADRITVDAEESAPTSSDTSPGIFETIVAWFEGNRGALSVRNR